jgi:hypothetical protein
MAISLIMPLLQREHPDLFTLCLDGCAPQHGKERLRKLGPLSIELVLKTPPPIFHPIPSNFLATLPSCPPKVTSAVTPAKRALTVGLFGALREYLSGRPLASGEGSHRLPFKGICRIDRTTIELNASRHRPSPAVGDRRPSGADKTIVESKISSSMSCFLSRRCLRVVDQPAGTGRSVLITEKSF